MCVVDFNTLLGKTLTSVEMVGEPPERIVFTTDAGERYVMRHDQDCCESVCVEDVSGDLNDLIGAPILKAEEASFNRDTAPEDLPPEGIATRAAMRLGSIPTPSESYTWTFYHLATVKGYVTIRWLGESSGYYSEGVNFEKADE